jgi:hypothetical protein
VRLLGAPHDSEGRQPCDENRTVSRTRLVRPGVSQKIPAIDVGAVVKSAAKAACGFEHHLVMPVTPQPNAAAGSVEPLREFAPIEFEPTQPFAFDPTSISQTISPPRTRPGNLAFGRTSAST